MKTECLFDKLVPVKELKPHPKNNNKHSKEQIARLAKILEYQGWRYPVKVSKLSGFITSGHARVEAAKVNGWKTIPVNFQDYESADQEHADLVADNAIASWSELDLSMLPEFTVDFDMELLGLKNFLSANGEAITDPSKEWDGMPEFNQDDKTSFRHVVVHFVNEDDAKDFFRIIGQNDTGKTKSIWFPPQMNMDTNSKRY